MSNRVNRIIYIKNAQAISTCPPDKQSSLAHPKIFLKFIGGQATCPYCGISYVIKNESRNKS